MSGHWVRVFPREPESKSSSSPSYTLADLERLGREFSDECQTQEDSVIEGLVLSKFAKWVGKKEREANVNQKS